MWPRLMILSMPLARVDDIMKLFSCSIIHVRMNKQRLKNIKQQNAHNAPCKRIDFDFSIVEK